MKNFLMLLAIGVLGFTLTGCGGVFYDDYYGGPDVGFIGGFFDGGGGGGGHWHGGHGGHGHGGGRR